MTLASVLIPAFRSADTLGIAVHSALRQTQPDLEVLIVGDGVDEATRSVAVALAHEDARVRFLDLAKAENRGELNRDVGIHEARSDVIVYLADDDILLPTHVENVLELMRDHNFVQSKNGYIAPGDVLELFPADLSNPLNVAWHLQDPPRNAVSITGTAHSRELYLRLDHGWEVPPPGLWSDLHMWRAFFRHPDFSGATHAALTTLQFPATVYPDIDGEDLRSMMQRWDSFSRHPDVVERTAALVAEAERRTMVTMSMRLTELSFAYAELQELAAAAERSRTEEQAAIFATLSWRVTAPLRSVRRRLR